MTAVKKSRWKLFARTQNVERLGTLRLSALRKREIRRTLNSSGKVGVERGKIKIVGLQARVDKRLVEKVFAVASVVERMTIVRIVALRELMPTGIRKTTKTPMMDTPIQEKETKNSPGILEITLTIVVERRNVARDIYMLSDFADEPEECLLSLSEENEVVFLDSCASKSIFIVKDANVMERVEPIRSSIQTTRADVQLECVGEGTFQHWTDVRVCPGSVKNIVSGGLLRAKGYGLMLLLEPQIVRLSDQSVVLPAKYAQNGMPYVLLWDLLNLPDLLMEESSDQVLLSDKIEIEYIADTT